MLRSPSVNSDWRRLLMGFAGLCLFLGGAVLIFTWPVSRTAPRDLPIGLVAPPSVAKQRADQLSDADPGAFDVHVYRDERAARRAIRHRDVYGALVMSADGVRTVTASAASLNVAQLITAEGEKAATRMNVPATVSDEVPYAAADPKGSVFSITLLPLTVCSVTIASVIAVIANRMRAWWEMLALTAVAAVGALLTYLIAQTWLGALPNQPLATWASMTMMILSISATAAGLTAAFGTVGTTAAAVLLIFVGNSFAGSQSAPDLLPSGVKIIGESLPPGAGANLLRSATYFDGFGWLGRFTILTCWVAAGFAAIVVGHQRAIRASIRAATTEPVESQETRKSRES